MRGAAMSKAEAGRGRQRQAEAGRHRQTQADTGRGRKSAKQAHQLMNYR
jgi:hypothetical protein